MAKPSDRVVEIGVESVIIEKMFGPTIFADLRITPDINNCQWVIERQRIDTGEWTEEARIPGQLSEEFDDGI